MSEALKSEIQTLVTSNPVVVFMKGTHQFPQCGFSARALEVLKLAGVKQLVSVNVLEDEQLWDTLEQVTKWPTVPQIFIHGEFIGGCDIVTEMHESGELQKVLKKA